MVRAMTKSRGPWCRQERSPSLRRCSLQWEASALASPCLLASPWRPLLHLARASHLRFPREPLGARGQSYWGHQEEPVLGSEERLYWERERWSYCGTSDQNSSSKASVHRKLKPVVMEETDIKVEVEEIVEPLALVKRVEVEGEAEVMELLENSNKICWVEDLLRISVWKPRWAQRRQESCWSPPLVEEVSVNLSILSWQTGKQINISEKNINQSFFFVLL